MQIFLKLNEAQSYFTTSWILCQRDRKVQVEWSLLLCLCGKLVIFELWGGPEPPQQPLSLWGRPASVLGFWILSLGVILFRFTLLYSSPNSVGIVLQICGLCSQHKYPMFSFSFYENAILWDGCKQQQKTYNYYGNILMLFGSLFSAWHKEQLHCFL